MNDGIDYSNLTKENYFDIKEIKKLRCFANLHDNFHRNSEMFTGA